MIGYAITFYVGTIISTVLAVLAYRDIGYRKDARGFFMECLIAAIAFFAASVFTTAIMVS